MKFFQVYEKNFKWDKSFSKRDETFFKGQEIFSRDD